MKTKFNLNTTAFSFTAPSSTVTTAMMTRALSPYERPSDAPIVIEIPGINIEGEVECSISELKELWMLQKEIMGELPEVVGEFMINLEKQSNIVSSIIGMTQKDEAVDANKNITANPN